MSFEQGLGTPTYDSRPTTMAGTIIVAPSGPSAGMRAVAERWVYDIEPGRWVMNGTSLPAAGAACLLILDDQGDAWAIPAR